MSGPFDVDAPLAIGVRWLLLLAYSGVIGSAVMHDLVVDVQTDAAVAARLRTRWRGPPGSRSACSGSGS